MVTVSEFELLLKRQESETLDFKSKLYDLSSDDKFNFIKDVLCMVNTPRVGPSYIVLGVKKHTDGTYELKGIDEHPDEATLQEQFTERIHPLPRFTYEPLSYNSMEFGLITIQDDKFGPCVPLKDYPKGRNGTTNLLRYRQVYVRRGSKNDVATPEDSKRFYNWLQNNPIDSIPHKNSTDNAWEVFLNSTHNFERMRNYILVTGPNAEGWPKNAENLGLVNWNMVIDFDPNSEAVGLLYLIKDTIEIDRSLHLVVVGDRPTLNTHKSVYWYFARGLWGRDQSLETGTWMAWKKRYGNDFREQFGRFSKATSPNPTTMVIIWDNAELQNHLHSVLEVALESFGDLIDFVIIPNNPIDVANVLSTFEAELISMPLSHICSGLTTVLERAPQTSTGYILPSTSGAPLQVNIKTMNWLEEELEVLHLDIGSTADVSTLEVGVDFLRGKEITWYELALHYDIERDRYDRIKSQIEKDLQSRRSLRNTLIHLPGAGGTTLGRRLLWDLHRQYPTAVIHRIVPTETIERIDHLASFGTSVLLLVEGSKVSDNNVDELFDLIKSRHLSVVILHVVRRHTVSNTSSERSYFLKSILTPTESNYFANILSREKPSRKLSLAELSESKEDQLRTPFYFGLTAFENNFLGIERYVSSRIKNLTEIQNKIIGFLALSHHYAQRTLPAQSFTSLLEVSSQKKIDIRTILPESALDLLVEQNGHWRTSHDLVAEELIIQLLTTQSGDRRVWRQSLSSWGVEISKFFRGFSDLISDEMLEVARRLFVYRDNSDLLGTERSANQVFSHFIEDIPSIEGTEIVLNTLVELYPKEPHFWAHLGRFYSIRKKDYKKATDCLDQAISLQEEDPLLHHMQGMMYRHKVNDLIESKSGIADLVPDMKRAGESFKNARDINNLQEHAFVSEIQMIIRVLDYIGVKNGGDIYSFLAQPTTDPYLRESLDQAEDLLETVKRKREGQEISSYVQDCMAKINILYGHHDQALQTWDNLLPRRDIFSPPIRRQIIRAYLARAERSWDKLKLKEIERIVDLLNENLKEEPNEDKNLKLWLHAIRRLPSPPSIESIIEKITYWKINTSSLEASYYLYVLYTLLAIEGSTLGKESAIKNLEECSSRTWQLRNRTTSLEWFGHGAGVPKLVSHPQLGNWNDTDEFWENSALLSRVRGRISYIKGPESGHIELPCGLSAFFVPGRRDFTRGQDENKRVEFYLGFSYDGLRAWDVKETTF